MTETISQELFTENLLAMLTEAFETVRGIFLDPGTSIFETLDGVTAAEASIRVGGKCATLAAQVAHVNFYLEVLERYMLTGNSEKVDWGEIWRSVREVTPDQWTEIRSRLRETYQRVFAMMNGLKSWDSDASVGGAMAIVVHSAYHLGEIRQALCTLR